MADQTNRGRRRGGGIWDVPPGGPGTEEVDPVAVGRRLRDFDSAAAEARVAIVLVGITSLASMVVGPWTLQRILSGSLFGIATPALENLSNFTVVAFIASAVAVAVWFKRAYDNIPALGATDRRYAWGWTIGGWLLPIANFVIPKQIADDLWRTSDPALPPDVGAGWRARPVPALLHLWWAAWIIQIVAGRLGRALERVALTQGDVSALKTAFVVETMSSFFLAIAGPLLIKFIQGVTARQREREAFLRAQAKGRVPAA